MRELKLMQRLRHPNVVQFLDSFETNSYIYVVMEYVENGSLAHMIKPQQFGKLSEGLAAKYTYEILLGLQYLHSKGIIHRDIKSANLLLTKDGKVKVADFGLAKVLEQVRGMPLHMEAGIVVTLHARMVPTGLLARLEREGHPLLDGTRNHNREGDMSCVRYLECRVRNHRTSDRSSPLV